MSLTVTQRPVGTTIYQAAFNPVVFRMTRKDYNITAVANSGGALQITVNTNLTTLTTAQGGPVIAGSILYVYTDNGVYAGSFTVVSVTNAASSVVVFTAGTYTSAATTGYINLMQRTGYYVSVEVYAGYLVASTNYLFKLRFTPDKAGLIVVDVSQLKRFMTPEVQQGMNLTTNQDNLHYKAIGNPNTSLTCYIKYTEVWTNSAETQTNDSANPFYVLHAAKQIGDPIGSSMYDYVGNGSTINFVNKLTRPRMWPGRKNSISWIHPLFNLAYKYYIEKTWFNRDGTIWGSTYDLIKPPSVASSTSYYESHDDCTTKYALMGDEQTGGGTAYTNIVYATAASGSLAAGSSKSYIVPFKVVAGKTYKVNFVIAAGVGGNITASLETRSTSGTLVQTAYTSGNLTSFANNTLTVTFTASSSAQYFGLYFNYVSGAAQTYTVLDFNVEVPIEKQVLYRIVYANAGYPTTLSSNTINANDLYCDIQEDPCGDVQLIWKNFLGGDQTFCFPFSQEYSIKTDDNTKAKTLKCFANNITLNELDVLNEMHTSGGVIDNALIELTSSVTKLNTRIGQNVYAITPAGVLTGVITKTESVKTDTKRKLHNFAITIEYAQIIHPQ